MKTYGKVVGRVGRFPAHVTFSGLRLERSGFLSLYSFKPSDATHRMDMGYRRDAVVMMPVDEARREIYMIRAPRHMIHFAGGEPGSCNAPSFAPGICPHLSETAPAGDMSVQVPYGNILTMEFPAGIIDPGEDPLTAAQRELREETGLRAPLGRFERIAGYFPSTGGSTERLVAFIVQVDRRMHGRAAGDGHETMEVRRLTFEDAWDLLDSGEADSASAHILLRELRIRYGAKPDKRRDRQRTAQREKRRT